MEDPPKQNENYFIQFNPRINLAPTIRFQTLHKHYQINQSDFCFLERVTFEHEKIEFFIKRKGKAFNERKLKRILKRDRERLSNIIS